MTTSKRQPTRWPNVKRYPDGTYYAYIKPMHGGHAKEVSLRTKKATMVPDALKLAELKVQRSVFTGSRLTFGDSIEDYLADRKREWAPRTYVSNRNIAINFLKPFFGRKKIAEIDHNIWDEYTAKKMVSDYMNHRYVLRNYLEWCMYKNWIPAMPLVFKLPKHQRRPRRILKPNEIIELVRAAKGMGRIETFMHLTMFHGLRGGEATGAQYDHVNFEKGCLIIPKTKTGRPRVVPLLPYTLELIAASKDGTSPFLFPKRGRPNQKGGPRWFQKQWPKLLKAAGLVNADGSIQDITPHDLRATGEKYASKLQRFTRTEREKMFGSRVEIQDSIYITEFFVDELRGLESAMLDPEKGVAGLKTVLESPRLALGELRESVGQSSGSGDLND